MGFHFTMQKVVNTKILKNNTFHQFRQSTTFGVAFHHPSGLTEEAVITAVDDERDRDGRGLSVCAVPSLAESMSPLIYERETRGVELNLGRYLVQFKTEALQ